MNTLKINIYIPCEKVLNKIKTTPALNQLTRVNLVVGNNKETVNHYQYSRINNMFPLLGCIITKIQ